MTPKLILRQSNSDLKRSGTSEEFHRKMEYNLKITPEGQKIKMDSSKLLRWMNLFVKTG